MEHEILGAKTQRAIDLSPKCDDRLREECHRLAAKIDQIAGVDGHRTDVISFAQITDILALFWGKLCGPPGAWARREYLERVAAQPVGAFDRCLDASAGRSVNPDLQP